MFGFTHTHINHYTNIKANFMIFSADPKQITRSFLQAMNSMTLIERHGLSNHRRLDCGLNSLFRLTIKTISILRITGCLWGDPTKYLLVNDAQVFLSAAEERSKNSLLNPQSIYVAHHCGQEHTKSLVRSKQVTKQTNKSHMRDTWQIPLASVFTTEYYPSIGG